ncbi:hypothetical protein FRB95_000441 [Tulasnella sp. JGI-2019a]|nr:hypothetical protein FRB95_000441 [Tulasnella sp. JGI-2019a]
MHFSRPLKAMLCIALATGGPIGPSKLLSLQTLTLQRLYNHGADLANANPTVLHNVKYVAFKEYEGLLQAVDTSETRGNMAKLLRSLLFGSEVDGSIHLYEKSYGPEGWMPHGINIPPRTPRMESEISEWLGGMLPPAAIWPIQLHAYMKADRYETAGNGYRLQSYWNSVIASFGAASREAVVTTLLGMNLNWDQLAPFMVEACISESTCVSAF